MVKLLRKAADELDALQKDKERLDWLATPFAKNGYVIATSRDGEPTSEQTGAPDLREAIDAHLKTK